MAEHRHDWQLRGQPLNLTTLLDDWLGPTLALIVCSECSQPALLHIVGWQGKQLAERLFAVRTLSTDAHRIYLHNINRDYCDLTRRTSETQALFQAADANAVLVRVLLPSLNVIDTGSQTVNPPILDWQSLPEEAFSHWQQFFPNA